MTTNQEGVHLAVRDITGTERSYNEDWHALFDSESIAAGPFNARMLAWINATLSTSYTNVSEAMQAFAVEQGFANWAAMNTFTAGSIASSLLDGEASGLAVSFIDGSMIIRDTGTPANNYSGAPSGKLTLSNSPAKWVRGADGNRTSVSGFVTEYAGDGNALGFRVEPAATNLFVNPRAPATQNITVTAQAYTLAFDGTGTITLSGVSTAGPLVGTGANERVYLTFTPTAGTLTLTVSGTMDFVQLETGQVATSPVTAGSRLASFPSIATSLFPFNGDTGTLVMKFRHAPGHVYNSTAAGYFGVGGYGAIDSLNLLKSGGSYAAYVTPDSFTDVSLGVAANASAETLGIAYNLSGASSAFYENGIRRSLNSAAWGTIDGTGKSLAMGARDQSGAVYLSGWIEWFLYVPRRMTDAEVAAVGAETAGPFDVFMVAGQSNNVSGTPFDAALDTPDAGIMQWTQNGYIAPAQDPLDHISKVTNGIGFAMTFARAYKAATGRRVLLVPCAQTATGFTTGHWNVGQSLYNAAVSRCNAALAAAPGSEFKGVLWHQGESDVSATGTYAASVDAIIAGFRSSITGATNVPFVAGGVADDFVTATGANGVTLQGIIADVGNRNANAAYVSAAGLATSDGTHFTAASQRTLGGRYYTAWEAL